MSEPEAFSETPELNSLESPALHSRTCLCSGFCCVFIGKPVCGEEAGRNYLRENHWQDQWWLCPGAWSILKDHRKGASCVSTYFPRQEFSIRLYNEKAHKPYSNTIARGGGWGSGDWCWSAEWLLLLHREIHAEIMSKHLETFMAIWHGHDTPASDQGVLLPEQSRDQKTPFCDRLEMKTTNQNPSDPSSWLVLASVLWQAQWGGDWLRWFIMNMHGVPACASSWGWRPKDRPWGAHGAVGKADAPMDSRNPMG